MFKKLGIPYNWAPLSFGKEDLQESSLLLYFRHQINCNGKAKHFNYNWRVFSSHASPASHRVLKKIGFALYGTCHKTSKTPRSLSMSSELKKTGGGRDSSASSEECLHHRWLCFWGSRQVTVPAGMDCMLPSPGLRPRWGGRLVGEKCWWSWTQSPTREQEFIPHPVLWQTCSCFAAHVQGSSFSK